MGNSQKIIRDTINRQSDKVTFPLQSNLLTILEKSISTPSSTLEAPISRWQEPVQETWVDYNGHLNVAYYTHIFDNAVEGF